MVDNYPNTLTQEFLNAYTINAWGGYTLKLDIEEKPEDIEDLIIYGNHGDEYVLVHANGKWFEYGCYANYDTYKNGDSRGYLRVPNLYCQTDDHSQLANKIYRFFYNEVFDYSGFRKKIKETSWAQITFNNIVKLFEDAYDSRIYYEQLSNKNVLREFLEKNSIANEENLHALESIHFDSKRDGLDGICGKKEIPYRIGVETFSEWYHNSVSMNVAFYVDDLVYGGSEYNEDILPEDIDGDEWGSYTWWVSPDTLVHKMALISDVYVPELRIAARKTELESLKEQISELQYKYDEALQKLNEELIHD